MLKRELPDETRADPAFMAIGYIVLNQTDPRFADKRVPRPFPIAIDRETISHAVLGNGEPRPGVSCRWHAPFRPPGGRDLAMPMVMLWLRRGGGSGGGGLRPLQSAPPSPSCTASARANKSRAVADMWKAVGADVRIEANEVKRPLRPVAREGFEVAMEVSADPTPNISSTAAQRSCRTQFRRLVERRIRPPGERRQPRARSCQARRTLRRPPRRSRWRRRR